MLLLDRGPDLTLYLSHGTDSTGLGTYVMAGFAPGVGLDLSLDEEPSIQ